MKPIQEKIILQMMEAQDLGMTKLAENVKYMITEGHLDAEPKEYSYVQLKDGIKKSLWKTATLVMVYHNVDSLDVKKFDEEIDMLAEKYVCDIEKALGKKASDIGPFEPKVPGQTK